MNVQKFLEKPQATETTSRYAVPALYYYPNSFLDKVDDFIEEKKDAPREQRDAPGICFSLPCDFIIKLGGLVVWTVNNPSKPLSYLSPLPSVQFIDLWPFRYWWFEGIQIHLGLLQATLN